MNSGSFRVLVCGGAGFIGSNFIRMMFAKHSRIKILNYDKLAYSGNPDNLKDIASDRRYKFARGDIADKRRLRKVLASFRPDYIINFAAETHVDKSIHAASQEFIDTNISGVFNLLEAVKQNPRIRKYVQVSTDEVYGSLALNSGAVFSESAAFAPNMPYAATKAGGDLLSRAYFRTFGVPVVVTHASNNFGPYQYPEKLIPFFILRMLEEKKLPLYGDGQNVRDWIYVLDHCRALESCLFRGRPGEVYNIGSGNEMSNLEIAKLILKYFNRDKSWIEFVGDRPGHDLRYGLDTSKMKRELGWRPIYSFNKAFRGTLDWYLDNKNWVNKVRRKTGIFNPHIDLWKAHRLKK